MNGIKVSVLVPIYNVRDYLEQCLDSLEAQTMKDIEFICINDGSTDGSDKIIQKYIEKDPRFKILSKENSGYGDSMNKGLDIAQGKYIGILESDDFTEPSMYATLYEKAEREQADIVRSRYWLYWDNGRNVEFDDWGAGVFDKTIKPADYPELIDMVCSIWSAIYRKDFLDKNDIRFLPTPGASYQDISFFCKTMMMAERMFFIKDRFIHYRQGRVGQSVRNHHINKALLKFAEYDECERYINDGHHVGNAILNRLRHREINSTVNDCFSVIEHDEYMEYARRYLGKIKEKGNYDSKRLSFYESRFIQSDGNLIYMNVLVLLWRVMHSFRHAYWLKRLPGVMLIKRKIFG